MVGDRPMRRGAASVQKPGLRQQRDACADAGDKRAILMQLAYPAYRGRVPLDHEIDVRSAGRN